MIAEILVFRGQDYVVQINAEVLRVFFKHRQEVFGDSVEAGGLLIGRHILDCEDIVVDMATEPMAGDLAGRFEFYRDDPGHQEILEREWAESDGTSVFVGAWHTHPESVPRPSNVDLEDWRRQQRFMNPDGLLHRGPHALHWQVIVGTQEIGVWEVKTVDAEVVITPLTLHRVWWSKSDMQEEAA